MRQEKCKLYQKLPYWIPLNILKKKMSRRLSKKISKLYQVFMCWIVVNILGQNVSKNQTRKLYQVFMYNFLCQNDFWTISRFLNYITKMFELYQVFVAKCFNTSLFYILKSLLSKNRFYFFLIFWHAKIRQFFMMPRNWH